VCSRADSHENVACARRQSEKMTHWSVRKRERKVLSRARGTRLLKGCEVLGAQTISIAVGRLVRQNMRRCVHCSPMRIRSACADHQWNLGITEREYTKVDVGYEVSLSALSALRWIDRMQHGVTLARMVNEIRRIARSS
jgi:hypothetical protein